MTFRRSPTRLEGSAEVFSRAGAAERRRAVRHRCRTALPVLLMKLCVLISGAARERPAGPGWPGPVGGGRAGGGGGGGAAVCGPWLAGDSMEVPAWDGICERVKLIISWAMSVSRMRDSEADRFSTDTFRLLIVCSRRFWYAPSLD